MLRLDTTSSKTKSFKRENNRWEVFEQGIPQVREVFKSKFFLPVISGPQYETGIERELFNLENP